MNQTTQKHKIELLAPAGGMDQLKAAVRFGADAVYLATNKYGMRARATNFSLENLSEAVQFAHDAKVKVYITCNILMHDKEIQELPQYFLYLDKIGVDALIIGDLGAFSVAKKTIPNMPIHISTQASVANSQAAKTYADLGANRIVLAREMSLREIKSMNQELKISNNKNYLGLQIEAFVHGAMCMSVSGRCLISSYLTGRSANRGHCTQPCRWGYNLQEEKRPGQDFNIGEDNYGTYILNSKDLCMLKYLDKLAEAGIQSIKIEGRNKKALYVATVVNAYRHVLDALEQDITNQSKNPNCKNTASCILDTASHTHDTVSHTYPLFNKALKKWFPELDKVSHRPYSTGFYFGEAQQSPDYDGYEQSRVHVADVLKCEQVKQDAAKKDLYKITVLCRNRFENKQELESLIPKKDAINIKVEELKIKNSPIEVANRATEIYTFTCSHKIDKGSFLRSKTYLRTTRKK